MPRIKTSFKIKTDFKGLTKLGANLRRQKSMIAEVGHLSGKYHSADEDVTIASISLVNQQGTKTIPARPYMLVALNSPFFVKEYNKAVLRIGKGESSIAKELPKLSKILRDVMMGTVQTASSWSVPNSRATIARKGKNQPLIHTATLVNDIESRIIRDLGRKRIKGFNTVV